MPIIIECGKRQLTYLWLFLNSENQIKDKLDIQLKECKFNTGSLANYLLHLLKQIDIKESLSYIASLSKKSGKCYCRKSYYNLIMNTVPRRVSIYRK